MAHVWRMVRGSDLEFAGKSPVGGNHGFQIIYGVDIARECHAGGTVNAGHHCRSGHDLLKVDLGIVLRNARSHHGTLFRDSGRADAPDVGQLYGVSVCQERCCISGGNLTTRVSHGGRWSYLPETNKIDQRDLYYRAKRLAVLGKVDVGVGRLAQLF